MIECERLLLGTDGHVTHDRVWVRQQSIVDIREQDTLTTPLSD